MSPPERPRGPITELNVSRGPHTPIPGPDARPTEPPPQAMPMRPPKHLAGPRPHLESHRDETTQIGLAPPAERRPEPVNPPPPESMRPPMPSVETGVVTVGKGKWSMSMPSAVALAMIACVGGAFTAWINKPNAGDPAEIAKAIRDEAAKSAAERAITDAAILKRLDTAETKLDRLQDSQDRLRERFNERFAK